MPAQLTLTGGTLTGGSAMSDQSHSAPPIHDNSIGATGIASANASTPAGASASSISQPHNHGHGHGHTRGQRCCNAHSPTQRPAKIDASALLPSKDVTRRFRIDKKFRLNVLSGVVRGGPYALFLNLLTVLVWTDDEGQKINEEAPEAVAGSGCEEERDGALLRKAGPESLAQMLDGYGADGHTLAHWCAKRGDEPRFLGFLIENSSVPNSVQLLIDLHLPSKDSVGMYPLHWAVTEGAIPLVSMILQHLEERPSPSRQLSSCAAGAGGSSSSSLVKGEIGGSGVDNGFDPANVGIDARDASGCTPLLIASQYGHPDLAAFLIRRGADPNAVDSSSDTALHWAAYKGSVEVCGMLLHLLGVEGQLDAQDSFGQTPLHLASLRGNVDTVMFLMEEAGGINERVGNLVYSGSIVGRVGSKASRSGRAAFVYPGKLLAMHDKEEKTPRDLAIKKKKLGCELLLQEYEQQYLSPKKSLLSRLGRTFCDLFSVRTWKAWMGMGGSELPIGQSPTFPFYWMTAHILLGGIFYATEFVGLGGRRMVGDDSLLWDKIGLHLFFVVSWFLTWGNLYFVYKTNPGILDARRDRGASSSSPATCQVICYSRGGYPKDKVSMEMDSVTQELRRQYDEIIESFSKDFPSLDKRVPLCHTCRIVKPLRSKHCRVARRCILLFDHHCPFVGTTVGLYNYIYFYFFLLSFCLMEGGFIAAWVIFLKRSKAFPVETFALGIYLSMYILPVLFMSFYHTSLILSNMSTNEQLNARKYQHFWDENGRFRNPFDQGKVRNILQRCWPDRCSYELGGPTRNSEVELVRQADEERQPMLSHVV